jgi:molecular chaperone Hsp33
MGLEVRAISDKHNIKIAIVDLTDGFKEIVKLQKPNMIAATALGKTLANTTLMSLSIKTHSEGTSKTHDLTPMILQPKKVIQVRYRKR